MNNTTTYPQRTRQAPQKTQTVEHPIRTEINKHVGSYAITAVFEEDVQSASLYKHPGLIAYLCTLKQGDTVLGQGRGMNVLSGENRYLAKSVKFAFNSALIDAVVRTSKFPEIFRTSVTTAPSFGLPSEAYGAEQYLATDRQKSYIKELVDYEISDEDERNQILGNLDTMTKEDASELIQQLKNNY